MIIAFTRRAALKAGAAGLLIAAFPVRSLHG